MKQYSSNIQERFLSEAGTLEVHTQLMGSPQKA